MTTQNLTYFVEICRDLNLSVTAARLFVTQQTLSGHIRRLETYFGVPLFRRCHTLELTAQGELLLSEAKQILAAEQRLFSAFGRSGEPAGSITAACHMARTQDYLPAAIMDLSRKFPHVEVKLLDAEKGDVDQLFARGEIDLSIGDRPRPFPGLETILLDSTPGCILIAESLLRRCLGAQTDLFLAHARQGVHLEEIPPEVPIVQDGIISGRSWICRVLPQLSLRPRAEAVIPDSSLKLKLHIEACKSGIAMLLVSQRYVDYLQKSLSPESLDGICILPHLLDGAPILREEYLAYDARRPHPDCFFYLIQSIRRALEKKQSAPLP